MNSDVKSRNVAENSQPQSVEEGIPTEDRYAILTSYPGLERGKLASFSAPTGRNAIARGIAPGHEAARPTTSAAPLAGAAIAPFQGLGRRDDTLP